MARVLLTGGTGFFGSILKGALRREGHTVVNLDWIPSFEDELTNSMAKVDLGDAGAVEQVFVDKGPFDLVCHLGAELAHESRNPGRLWRSNVDGTRNLVEAAWAHRVPRLIFTSTNCLWGRPLNRPVREDDKPDPVEPYGRSKLAAEKLLLEYKEKMVVIIFRSPTIIASGRVGLLGILFDFVREGRRLPVVGTGQRPYQFLSADDYARAFLLAMKFDRSEIFHVGSDHPVSLETSYRYLIDKAGSRSRIYHLPEKPTIWAMKLCHDLHLSPLGPYHYGMISQEFVFDTERVKGSLSWKPTKTNQEILYEAYDFYTTNRDRLQREAPHLPAHCRKSGAGIINLLRWFS